MIQKILVAGAFLIKNNHVLLALRQDSGTYGLIGGKVDNHESIDQALSREIFEEIGIVVSPQNMNLMQVISFVNALNIEMVSFDFVITEWQGDCYNKEPNKHQSIAWFPLDNLPANIIDRHTLALENYKKGIYYSAQGYLLKEFNEQ